MTEKNILNFSPYKFQLSEGTNRNLDLKFTVANDGEWLKNNNPVEQTKNVFLERKTLRSGIQDRGNSQERSITSTDDDKDISSNNSLDVKYIDYIGIESLNPNIEPSNDNVSHIIEAIIAHAANLDDKKLVSGEKEFTENEIKDKFSSFVNSAESKFKNTPLCGLNILKCKSTALKRVNTKLLAKVCTDAFNKIKDNKDIQKCVNGLSKALFAYNNNKITENCQNIIKIQKELKEKIESTKHIESVNEILNMLFVRMAVDKFYKNVDLSNSEVILDIKSTFNSLFKEIKSIEQTDRVDLNAYLKNLVYGFGFYPSSIDVSLETLKKENANMEDVLSALGALSKEYALTIKNGKKFEIVNTGSHNDRNCVFRAISIGAGLAGVDGGQFGPNGYNTIQQKVVEGANWVLENWKNLDEKKKNDISEMLMWHVDTKNMKKHYSGNVKDLLNEYIDCRKKGFVSSVKQVECLFAAIGLGCPICVSDNEDGTEYTFLPDGRKENGICGEYPGFGKPIYAGFISGHAEALIPLNDKNDENIQKMDDAELNKKVSDVKDAISRNISGVIHGAICNKSSMLSRIIARNKRRMEKSFIEAFLENPECKKDENLFVAMKILDKARSKLPEEKKDKVLELEGEIMTLPIEKAIKNNKNKRCFLGQKNDLQDKLKQFVDIFAKEAVEICQKKPLFWDNVENSVLNLW